MKNIISISLLMFTAIATSFSQVPNYLPQNGLIGWWPFNSNAQDESGNGNEGQVFGATLTNDRFGIPNAAYEFNDNYIVIPDNSIFNFTNLSFSLWIKTNSQNTQSVFKKCNYEDASNEIFGLGTVYNPGFGGQLTFASKFDDGDCSPGMGWYWSIGSQNISDGQYHHIVCTVNENIVKMYIDGIVVSEIFSDYPQISSCFGGDIQIGRDWSVFPHYYHGVVDDIGMWNRALTDDEVLKLYRASEPDIETSIDTNGHIINNFDINLDIYPNPTTDVVNIDFHDLNKFEGGKVKIMSMSGQIVYEENITQSKMTLSVVDRFSKGIYIVTTTDSGGNIMSTEKLIVQ